MNIDFRSRRTGALTTQNSAARSGGLWWSLRNAASRAFGLSGRAERLTSAAGAAESAARFEALEGRQLLAVITINPSVVDPATGLGTVEGFFDIINPYLYRQIPDADTGDPEVTIDEFEDEMGWANTTGVPPNGVFLAGSEFQVQYRTQAANAVLLLPPGPGTIQFNDPDMDRDFRVALQTTDQFGFAFWQGTQGGMNPMLRRTTNLTVRLRNGLSDNNTLITGANGTRLELTRNNNVVQTYQGAELAALMTLQFDGTTLLQLTFQDGFDGFRFRAADQNNTAAYADDFIVDDVSTIFPSTRFASFVDERRSGVRYSFTGEAGATVQFLDLYLRDIQINSFIGIPEGGTLPIADANGDGVPDFNDGIGQIRFSNTNSRTSFTMIGGTASEVDTMTGEIVLPQFPDNVAGQLDDFEQDGFGFYLDGDNMNPTVVGIPEGSGGILIGSPIVRDNSTPNRYLFPNPNSNRGDALNQITQGNFNRANQGIFVDGSIGSLVLHAATFGSTVITGSVDRFNTGAQYGSVTIQGDAGYIGIAGDAGILQPDDFDNPVAGPFFADTAAQLLVGRTIGELAVGGRMGMSVQVLADINNPARTSRKGLEYTEREVVYAINPQASPAAGVVLGATLARNDLALSRQVGVTGITGQATFFGNSLFRNDTLQNSEFVGYNGTAVRLVGALGARDPINGEDFTDVYAFVADSSREVVIQGAAASLLATGYARVVDRNGIVVASADRSSSRARNNNATGFIRFRPDQAGVYYLVLSAPPNGGFVIQTGYDITISGMAPTTFGALTVAGGIGSVDNALVRSDLVGTTVNTLVTLNAGSMGVLRSGMGYTNPTAEQQSPGEYLNVIAAEDDLFDVGVSSISVPGNLYAFIAGGDVNGLNLSVGRNLGIFQTGFSPIVAGSNQQGDLSNADIRVGGTIGTLDISGGIAIIQDPDTQTGDGAGTVSIRTGTAGGRGDIGQILSGAYVNGTGFLVTTSPGSVIDQFILRDGPTTQFDATDIRYGVPLFNTGIGSDIRFVDFGLIQTPISADAEFVIASGQSLTFTDDGGARFTISVTGAGSSATVLALPVQGSQGVVVSRIEADLLGGGNLVITAVNAGSGSDAGATISIGRIIVTGDGNPASRVLIGGNPGVVAEIDVWRIDSVVPLLEISNTTTGRNGSAGDIVAIDALALNRITIAGNLGRTRVNGAGPSLLGPFLGIAGGTPGVGGPLGVDEVAVNNGNDDWNGDIFLPIQIGGYGSPSSLEDQGSPVDGTLNGAIIRTGDVVNAQINGAVGDLIVQTGDLINLVVNADTTRAAGAFDGIVGSIYADRIGTIDIGDGLRGPGPSSFAQAGIFADNDIININATRIRGASITGVVLAADVDNIPSTTIGTGDNVVNLPGGRSVQGIGAFTIIGATVDNLGVFSEALDDWWQGLRAGVRDVANYRGRVDSLTLIDSTLFRSEVVANIIGTVSVTGGAFDATLVQAADSIGLVSADEFRNTTRLGDSNEFRVSQIVATRSIGTVTTTGQLGDMIDLSIAVVGSITGRIAARDLVRVAIDADNSVNEIAATQDAQSVSVVAGRVGMFTVGRDFRNTSMDIAGAIEMVTAGGAMRGVSMIAKGNDGRIGTVTASGDIQADFSSSGPIALIESTNGDIVGTLVTTDIDGSIETLRAGRDLLLDVRILANASMIEAGRNVGRRTDGNDRALDIRGNLGSLSAGSQIFSDVLVGQSITGTISNGRVRSKPGDDQVGTGDIIAFGRINELNFQGDVNGNITSKSGGIGTITINNGSFRKGRTITALDGSIDRITITGGDLLGDIYADGDLTNLELLSTASFKGQIGVSKFKSSARTINGDNFRNQLPPETFLTAGIDGPRIYAGHDIVRLFVQGGNIWESTIQAGRSIRSIEVRGGGINNDNFTTQQGTSIIAGDTIETILVSGKSDRVSIVAGVLALGSDNALGGVGSATDTIKESSIGAINFRGGGTSNIRISAGMNAGADGVYNTNDDRLAAGRSAIASVNVQNARTSSVYADGGVTRATGGNGLTVVRNGRGLAAADTGLVVNRRPAGSVQLRNGVVFNFTTSFGQQGSLLFNGPGRAFYDAANIRVVLIGTTDASSLVVQGRKNGNNNMGSVLRDFSVYSSQNSSLGSLNVRAFLRQDSNIFIDGGIRNLTLARSQSTGIIGSGGDINTITAARIDSGTIRARSVGTFRVNNGFFGGQASFLDLGTLAVSNQFSGVVSSDHDIDEVSLAATNGGAIRSGGDIGPVMATRMNGTIISARDSIRTVDVTGDVRDSAFYAGSDLGRDGGFGGDGLNADVVSNGTIGDVTVGGSFPMSDIAAGVYRGPDGFLGTADDRAADGRSQVGRVEIAGRTVGSTINSEQYRIVSTGNVGAVLVNDTTFETQGNFSVNRLGALPVPVIVTDLVVFEDSRIYRAELRFNQPIDAASLTTSLSIAEIRGGGSTLVGLAQGSDYTVRYNSVTNVATITFSRNVTDRSLPQQLGVPGPGLMRFVLSGATFRGASQGVLLDGNGDGSTGDDYTVDAVVGDAGDKITAGSTTLPDSTVVDFYSAVDLNLLLDDNVNSDNNPDVNRAVRLRGTMGDHPDSNSNSFRAGGDVDLYRVNLRAGQVLVLGEFTGNAISAARAVFTAAGASATDTGAFTVLPSQANANGVTATAQEQYLVNITGVYFIGVSGTFQGVNIANTANVPNNNPLPGAVGPYAFDVLIFDDGNTGFNGDTDAGDGSLVADAPVPAIFAGSDGQFGTSDDLRNFIAGRFTFTLDRGADGQPNTADDVVTGTDGGEITSVRRSGPDRQWNTVDDERRSTINGAIGLPGGLGVPSLIAPDADIYRLNNGQPLLPGTRVRLTFRITDTGGNIGFQPTATADDSQATRSIVDNSLLGDVQIALFELPAGTGFSNAKLVAAPSAFQPIGNQKPETVTDGVNAYGYDANGDFFMEVVLPGSQDVTGVDVPASYAAYVQGAVRSDYSLEILTQGTGTVARSSQNVLIEINGGTIDWLETSGLTTQIEAFNASVLGFAGQINGVDVDDYVVTNLVSTLNSIFEAANLDIRVSSDASDFEGQDFSTVYIAGNTEPNAFFNNGSFGATQRVDMLNIDKNDQAVVFAPSLAVLGNNPDQQGVDLLVQSLAAAAGRRIGELVGLRQTGLGTGNTSTPIMWVNSVTNPPGAGGSYGFTNVNAPLSGRGDFSIDTNFYLGTQNSLQLIQRIIKART